MTRRSVILGAAAVVAAIALVIAVVVVLAPRLPGRSDPDAAATAGPPPITFAEQSPQPVIATERRPGWAGAIDLEWAQAVADVTDIPVLAVVAYAGGALAAEYNFPGCGIGWNTLAGIGLIESDHGRHGGGVIDESGRVDPSFRGVPRRQRGQGDRRHRPGRNRRRFRQWIGRSVRCR